MLSFLSDLESIDPKCSTDEKFKQLKLVSNLLETENFLIGKFLENNKRTPFQSLPSNEDKSPGSDQFACLQQTIDIADKMCLTITDKVEQLEIKSSDKWRNLNATKSELDLSCQDMLALRISIEQKFQTNDSTDACKSSHNLSKFVENWSHSCKQKRDKAHSKATILKRLCAREEQDVSSKSQVMKQMSPAEYVRLQFDSKKCRNQLDELRMQISKLRKEHAIILSRKITENRKSTEIAKMRRKILTDFKDIQVADETLRVECDQMTETIAQMEKQIEAFRERVNETELPRVSISDYAKCKEKCEKLASVVKVVERKMSLAKKSA